MDYRPFPVLVVDDEVENLDAFRLNFGRKFTVLTATCGVDGLEIARKERIAVAIADQRMPDMPGTEFLAELRKVRPDAVRMILTGYTDLESVIAAVNEGKIARYITKPWEARDLESVVRQAIDHFRRGVERRRRLRELNAYNRILSLIAADLGLSRVVKEVLELVALDFNYARTFLLLGDAAADEMGGQAVLRESGAKPKVVKICAPIRGPDAPLAAVVAATGGFSAERFAFAASAGGAPVEFAGGPFYGAPLAVGGRVVGLLCADRGNGRDRTDRDDARFIATMASQLSLAAGGWLTAENLQRKGVPPVEGSGPTKDPTQVPKRQRATVPKPDFADYPVLLVDEDPASRQAFRSNFGETFHVFTAETVHEAVDLCRRKGPSVIVVGQGMRGRTTAGSGREVVSGIDLLAEMRDRDPDCVRIVLTRDGDIEEIIGAVNRGLVYRYLSTPWDVRELGNALRDAVAYYHELSDSRRAMREAEVVNRLMTVVAGETDPLRVAEQALRIATEDLGYDRAYFFEYDEPTGHLARGRMSARERVETATVERLRIPVIRGGGCFATAVLDGKARRSSDGPTVPGGVEIEFHDRRTTLAVPIGGAEPLGVIAFELAHGTAREIKSGDETTAETIAEVLAVSMKHARRLAELTRAKERA